MLIIKHCADNKKIDHSLVITSVFNRYAHIIQFVDKVPGTMR